MTACIILMKFEDSVNVAGGGGGGREAYNFIVEGIELGVGGSGTLEVELLHLQCYC